MESGDEKSLGVQSKGRNITPPDSRRESGDEKSIGGGTVQTSNTTGSLPNGILSGASTNASMSSNHEGSRYNEKLVTSLRVSPLSTGSPSIRGKRFHIPTILESAPESSPPTPGMKRRNSKGLDDLVVLNSNTQRNALEKHRPKSFTLAPTTPLTPAIMSLFDGQLPSEQYTINHIMQVWSLFPSTHLSDTYILFLSF